jgi:hypothetical protein
MIVTPPRGLETEDPAGRFRPLAAGPENITRERRRKPEPDPRFAYCISSKSVEIQGYAEKINGENRHCGRLTIVVATINIILKLG